MLKNAAKSLLIILLIISVSVVTYAFWLGPRIAGWGATPKEIALPLPGDDLAPFISSTRAITINKPPSEVWSWLVQLGADRSGFYSYSFIEIALGYEGKRTLEIVPEFQKMPVGRIVPSSLDDSKSVIKYSWPVVAIEPGKYFVLKGWGTFFLEPTASGHSRLIVRTNGWDLPTFISKLQYPMVMVAHHIMERRMLIGIKQRAEAGPGVRLPIAPDIIWFLGVFLSGLGIVYLVFISRGFWGVLLALIFSVLLLWVLLIFDPQPFYSLALLLLIIASVLGFSRRRKSYAQS